MRHAITQPQAIRRAGGATQAASRRPGWRATRIAPSSPRPLTPPRSFAPGPTGATLTEVLISILIMSIGVVTLATLFPISVLRSVQATQLTNATILRFNAEAIIRTLPYLVHDPNHDGNYREHFQRSNHRNFIVDPLGYHLIDEVNPTALSDLKPWFGNDGQANPSPISPPERRMRRFGGGTSGDRDAAAMVTLPDSWVLQGKEIPTAANLRGTAPYYVTLPPNVDFNLGVPCEDADADGTLTTAEDLDGDGVNDVRQTQITFFSGDGRSSHVRIVDQITSAGPAGPQQPYGPPPHSVQWNDALPAGFAVGEVQVETQERRYTWLLTVRKRPGGKRAGIDVVVCFRRTFGPEDEVIYSHPTNADEFVAGERSVTIRWVGEKPFYKKGGWVLDAQNARWYRIQDIINEDDQVNMTVELVLEDEIVKTGSSGAILMRGVIQVYPIGLVSVN